MRHGVQQDVADALDDRVLLLALVQRVAQACVDGDDVVDIPEDLLEEVGASAGGDDVRLFERVDPGLKTWIS
jgi:hypothetical protein